MTRALRSLHYAHERINPRHSTWETCTCLLAIKIRMAEVRELLEGAR